MNVVCQSIRPLSLVNTILRSRVRWLGRGVVASLHTSCYLHRGNNVLFHPLHLPTEMLQSATDRQTSAAAATKPFRGHLTPLEPCHVIIAHAQESIRVLNISSTGSTYTHL